MQHQQKEKSSKVENDRIALGTAQARGEVGLSERKVQVRKRGDGFS